MNDKTTLSALTLDDLVFTDGKTLLGGVEWEQKYWNTQSLRRVVRNTPAGRASISQAGSGKFHLELGYGGECEPGENIELSRWFDSIVEAAKVAEFYDWQTVDFGGYKWHLTRDDAEYKKWEAVIGTGDKALIWCSKEGEFTVKREVRLHEGDSYSVDAHRYRERAITSFGEAVGIVLTLPQFIASIAAQYKPVFGK